MSEKLLNIVKDITFSTYSLIHIVIAAQEELLVSNKPVSGSEVLPSDNIPPIVRQYITLIITYYENARISSCLNKGPNFTSFVG